MTSFIELLKRGRGLGFSYRAAATLLALNLAAVLFEGIGIAMLLPIFEYLDKAGDIDKLAHSGRHWAVLIDLSQKLSIPLDLPVLLIASFTAIVMRQVFTYWKALYHSRVLFGAIHQLRARAFSLSLRASTATQQDSSIGQAVNDVAVELPKAINALYGTVNFVSRLVLLAVYLGGLVLLAPWMTVLSLGVLAALALSITGLLRQSGRTSAAIVEANRSFSAFLVERMQSLRLIRLSGTEAAELANLSRLSARQRDNEIRMRAISAKVDTVIEPVAILIGFTVLYVGYSHFHMPLGSLGMFIVVMMRLLPLAKDILGMYQSIAGQWQSLTAIDERMKLIAAEREPKGGARQLQQLHKGIAFKDVTYAYSGDTPALRAVTCKLPAGKMTALVGPSGSGKSTFIDLLPRLRDPDNGVIMFDDVPLNDFVVKSLRAGIAFVSQSPQVFNVSVAEHIRYGRPDASDGEVREAARLAGAAEFIERMPNGYNTLLGDNGNKLSGGQRQRLDIARALVKRSPILILDEPSSQLDAESEQMLRETMLRIRQETDSTIIIVGHRLSTVADADQIIVFDQGAIVDSGSHAELLRRGGWYAGAFKIQFSASSVPKFAVSG